MTLGGNPLNTVWLSGLGEKRCRQILHIDSWGVSDARKLDDVVPGLVPPGPTRFFTPGKGIHRFSQEAFYPAMINRPALEQYAENRYDPSMNEHTCVMLGQAAAYAFMHGLGAR